MRHTFRDFLILACLLWGVLWATSAHSKVVCEDHYPPGKLIDISAEFEVPDGEKVAYEWRSETGLDIYEKGVGKNILATGLPGMHELQVIAARTDGESNPQIMVDTVSFQIGDSPDPPPQPDNLKQLVGPALAPVLAGQFADFADAVSSGAINTTAIFWRAFEIVTEDLEIPAKASAVIVSRLESVAPRESQPVDQIALTSELTRLAEELGGDAPEPEPQPDPIESGPRTAVILYESGDEGDEFGELAVKLRTGTAQQYLQSNGHKLYVLDDDTTDETGEPAAIIRQVQSAVSGKELPVLVILDSSKVLYSAHLADGTTADNVIETIRRHGG